MKKTEKTTNRATTREFFVEGITNETNDQILDFCDINNFGGVVHRNANGTATVTVYID